nr:MAG TPA: replication initiator protein [Caudoviricetes sp.]
MLCLENWRLSIRNNWVNEEGEIYFYAAQEIMAEKMKLDKKAIIRAFKKLVENGLLQVEKEKGLLNKYFLTDLTTVNIEDQYQMGTGTSTEKGLPPVPKEDYGSDKKGLPPVPKRDTIKNKYNKNELIRMNNKEYIFVNWNNLASELGLSKLVKWTDSRKRKLDKLLKKYSMEEITEALEKIRESDFLQGKKGNWKMTFDDFIEERKFVKLLEDGYKDNDMANKKGKAIKQDLLVTEESIAETLGSWGYDN